MTSALPQRHGVVAASAAAGGITVGTVQAVQWIDGLAQTFNFNAPTVDGDGAALVLIVSSIVAHGDRTQSWATVPTTFTLDGSPVDDPGNQLLARFIIDSGDRYCQSTFGLWTNPTSGPVVWTPRSPIDLTGCMLHALNLSGLAASPLGTATNGHVAGGTALPFQITPVAGDANGFLLSSVVARGNPLGPNWTLDNGALTSLGELAGGGVNDGAAVVAYLNPVTGTNPIECGGDVDVSQNEAQGLAGQSLILRAA